MQLLITVFCLCIIKEIRTYIVAKKRQAHYMELSQILKRYVNRCTPIFSRQRVRLTYGRQSYETYPSMSNRGVSQPLQPPLTQVQYLPILFGQWLSILKDGMPGTFEQVQLAWHIFSQHLFLKRFRRPDGNNRVLRP